MVEGFFVFEAMVAELQTSDGFQILAGAQSQTYYRAI